MKNKYSVKELSNILGCSVTAVNKKIRVAENNPLIKRYRNIYETVVENGITYILLSVEELEKEKSRSRGFNNVFNTGFQESKNEDIITVEPCEEEKKRETLIEFTERYINNITMLQKTFYEEMREKDKQIYLLTTSDNQKQAEYIETKALNKTLEKRNNILKTALTVALTLLITLIGAFIMFYFNVSKNIEDNEVISNQVKLNVEETFEQ